VQPVGREQSAVHMLQWTD